MSIVALMAPLKKNDLIKNQSHSILKNLKNAAVLIQNKKAMPFLVCALLMMISQLSYSAYMPVYLDDMEFSSPAILMQIAVIAELLSMLFLPLMMIKISIESLMLIGTFTYALRSFLTIYIENTNFPLMITVLILNGVSWVIFFISFDMYIKKISFDYNLHQMQGLKVIFINGLGVSLSSLICGHAYNHVMKGDDAHGWQLFWGLPFIMAATGFVILICKRKSYVPIVE
ncbi:hypothetical protein J2X14_000023 [Pantoea alhagi]|nr:hypothetical protein [Pantoea alhagi]